MPNIPKLLAWTSWPPQDRPFMATEDVDDVEAVNSARQIMAGRVLIVDHNRTSGEQSVWGKSMTSGFTYI
jgi:hypothetical protein